MTAKKIDIKTEAAKITDFALSYCPGNLASWQIGVSEKIEDLCERIRAQKRRSRKTGKT